MGLADYQELQDAIDTAVYNAVAGWVSREADLYMSLSPEVRFSRRMPEMEWRYVGVSKAHRLEVTTSWDKTIIIEFGRARPI